MRRHSVVPLSFSDVRIRLEEVMNWQQSFTCQKSYSFVRLILSKNFVILYVKVISLTQIRMSYDWLKPLNQIQKTKIMLMQLLYGNVDLTTWRSLEDIQDLLSLIMLKPLLQYSMKSQYHSNHTNRTLLMDW